MRHCSTLLPAWLAAVAAAAQHQFNVHEDLLAFPQFQVAFPDSFILESDARSKLDFVSSSSSARSGAQATRSSSDNAPSVRTPSGGAQSQEAASDLPQSYEYMVLDTVPYLCSVPQVEDTQQNDTTTSEDQLSEEKELDRARARGSELIGSMGEECLYYVSGWWSYSFCYNAEVKQFHQLPPGRNGIPFHPPIEDKNVPSYVLGQYIGKNGVNQVKQNAKAVEGHPKTELPDGEDSKVPEKPTDLVQVQSKGNLRYLVQKLDDGTTCDLTGRPRRVEIQYHCQPQGKDRIVWIKEISTCAYLMMVYTNKLCEDVAFSPPQENDAHQILCREIVAEDKVEEWRSKQAERKLAELLAQGATAVKQQEQVEGQKQPGDAAATGAAEPKPEGVIIGGIELGGQKTVGMPGKRLEPPVMFQGPAKDQKKQNSVIVRFDPKKNNGKPMLLSDKDFNKLGVDPEIAKEMAEEMYAFESVKKWRIEISNDELVGIIEDNEEKAKKDKPKKDDPKAEGSEEEYYKDEL